MKNKIVSYDEWLSKRLNLLDKEKALTKLQDEISYERRQLPWVRLSKEYHFNSANGTVSLIDLFGKNSQLIIYHFMFQEDWEEGCKSCSIITDSLNPCTTHLNARDVSLVLVSRAELKKLTAFKKRMGWTIDWVSSPDNEFNIDFHVCTDNINNDGDYYYNYRMMSLYPQGELPGLSVFKKDSDDNIYHTYSTYGRGLEAFIGTYRLLDTVPEGRNEAMLAWPMEWIKHNDQYDTDEKSSCCRK